jgi:hypothetical protein
VTFDSTAFSATITSVIPEPSTWVLLAAGLGVLAWRRRR